MFNLVIKVNDGEIPLSPGDFWRKNKAGNFVSMEESDEDSIKLIGIDSNNTIFVSEKLDDDMNDEEYDTYSKRKNFTGRPLNDITGNPAAVLNGKIFNFTKGRYVDEIR